MKQINKNTLNNMIFLNNMSEKINMVLITLKIKYMPVTFKTIFLDHKESLYTSKNYSNTIN